MNYNFYVSSVREVVGIVLAISSVAFFAQVSFAQTSGSVYPTTSTVDTIPPSVPIISAVLASPSSVVISWGASTDNVGVYVYRVYRNEVLIGSTNLLSYTDSSGISLGSSYTYKVASIDGAGNQSSPSNSVVIVTPTYQTNTTATTSSTYDTTPPSAPVLVLQSTTHTQVAFSWTASQDNVGVYGYRIYRNGVAIGSTQDLSYYDSSGIYAGASYTYKVTAYDTADNHSFPSNVVSVTIPAATANVATTTDTSATGTATTTSTSTTTTTTFVAPPVISQVRLSNIFSTGVQIKWLTDVLSDSRVIYGTAPGSYNYSEYNKGCQSEMLAKEHCINLTNLVSGIKYYFKVASRHVDSTTYSTAKYSDEQSFVIPSSTESNPPVQPASATTTKSTNATTTSVVVEDTTKEIEVVTTNIEKTTTETTTKDSVQTTKPPIFPTKVAINQIVPSTSETKTLVGSLLPPVISVRGGTRGVQGEKEVYVKFPDNVSAVEARIIRQGSENSHYIAQAIFDHETGRWTLSWDSTQTPDGSYKIFALATMPDGQTIEGPAIPVSVVNEKAISPSVPATSIKKPAERESPASGQSPDIAKNIEDVSRTVIDVEKVIEEVKIKQLQKEEQIKNELIDFLNKYAEGVDGTTTDFEEIVEAKSQEIHEAVLSGDSGKKQEIIMSLVASGVSGASTNEVLVKEIEKQVEKLEQVADEKKNGTIDTENFSVDLIKVAEVATSTSGVEVAKKIEFRGKALPNTFATLYIYSIPILVTVKTDNEGYWSYTLDKELEDGKHQVYVGITDVKGNVVVKSSPIPFIKVANAVTLEEIAPVVQPDQTPSFVGNMYFYGSIAIILILLVLLAIFIGIKRNRESSVNS